MGNRSRSGSTSTCTARGDAVLHLTSQAAASSILAHWKSLQHEACSNASSQAP